MAEMATSRQANKDKKFCVLQRDKTGRKIDKVYSSVDLQKFVSLGKGEILERRPHEKPPDPMGIQRFTVVDRPSVYVDCCRNEAKKIDEDEALLLLPVSSLNERLRLLEDRKVLEFGKKLKEEDYVYVSLKLSKSQNARQDVEGIIRYKGPLEGSFGIQFGVEIVVRYTMQEYQFVTIAATGPITSHVIT
jgi:hypothetical protein